MDRLQAMQVFTRVVDTNSFSRAADTLDLPRASVTTIIQNLEAFLSVRLLQRTTRRLSSRPTAPRTTSAACASSRTSRKPRPVRDERERPRGKLRVDMPGAIGRLLVMPSLCEFHTRYPDIELIVGFGDKPVDLIQEGVDCVIRVGTLQDSSSGRAAHRRVSGPDRARAPQYIERHGVPTTHRGPGASHGRQLFFEPHGPHRSIGFRCRRQKVEVKMRGIVSP